MLTLSLIVRACCERTLRLTHNGILQMDRLAPVPLLLSVFTIFFPYFTRAGTDIARQHIIAA